MVAGLPGPEAVVAAGTMVDILGPRWSSWVDLVRNVALVGIAPSLFVISWLVDRTSTTHRVIHSLIYPQVMPQLERLRLYNKFRQRESPCDPYRPDDQGCSDHDLLFDLGSLLNYYESICAEIHKSRVWKGVWTGTVYEVAASMIIGIRNHQLEWYGEFSEDDPTRVFPNIYIVAENCEKWVRKRHRGIFDRLRPKPQPSPSRNDANSA